MTPTTPEERARVLDEIIAGLKPVARLTDVTYTETVTILCKHCGSKNVVKYGKKGETQYYLCRDCKRTFAGNDALPGMKYPPAQIYEPS